MSVTRITSIHCDGCGTWRYGHSPSVGDTAAEIRRMLRTEGWRVGEHGMDICPECQGRAEQPRSVTPPDQNDL